MADKHTPGPWKNNGGRIKTERDAYNGGIIATVGIVNNQDLIDTANAELIAAAPELLEAIEDIEVLSRPDDAEKQGAVVYREELLNDIGKIARVAIAKAKPQTPASNKPEGA